MKPFGEWLPDGARLENPGVLDAFNVIPEPRGYRVAYYPGSTAFDESLEPRGAFSFLSTLDGYHVALGHTTSLKYQKWEAGAKDSEVAQSVTTLAADTLWRFTQFGDYVVAVGGVNQASYVFRTDSLLLDEDGAPVLTEGGDFILLDEYWETPASMPNARYVATVKDFVVCGHISESGAVRGNRLRWCALDDVTDWAIDPTTQADFQDLADAGDITEVFGGEIGIIVCEKAIYRMTYVGAPVIFQFDKIANVGCPYVYGATMAQGLVYFYGTDDFYVTDGSSVRGLARGKIINFFKATGSDPEKVMCGYDPQDNLVIWTLSKVAGSWYAYSVSTGQWTRGSFDNNSQTFAPSSMDTITAPKSLSNGSRYIGIGDSFLLVGNNTDDTWRFMGTTADTGVKIETATFTLGEGRTSLLTKVHHFGALDTTVSAAVSSSDTNPRSPFTSLTFGTTTAMNGDEFAPVRSRGRYHTIRFTYTAPTYEDRMLGYDVTGSPTGLR